MALIDDDIVTLLGSHVIKTIRTDDRDIPHVDDFFANEKTLVKFEHKNIKFDSTNGTGFLRLICGNPFNQLRLNDLPKGTYTLKINDIPVMYSHNMLFDINNAEPELEQFIKIGNKPCDRTSDNVDMNGHQIPVDLDIGILKLRLDTNYDIKICYPDHFIIPDVINLYGNIIYKNTYKLKIFSPTEYLTLDINRNKIESETSNLFHIPFIVIKLNDYVIAEIKCPKNDHYVIKFGKRQNHMCGLSDDDRSEGNFFTGYGNQVGTWGIEDYYLLEYNPATLNMSRVDYLTVSVSSDITIKSISSGHYMSYYYPEDIPRYNHWFNY